MLVDLLRGAAAGGAERPFLASPARSVSHRAAADEAVALARGLAARGIERFAIVSDDRVSVILLLVASSIVGAEACVYPASLDDDSITEYATAFGHQVVVSDRTSPEHGFELVSLDELVASDGPEPLATDGPAPVLILTTGTTGRPKGARHAWQRLVAATRRSTDAGGDRWLLAYNLNQFAGIQVLLHALVNGATLVVPPSIQPRDALAMIRDFGVTHVSATATFWRFLLANLDDGRLPLRQITLGGEAVPGPLLQQLRDRFPEARITQIYASTEFGSSVSVGDGTNGLPTSVLGRGEDADVQFRIVDGELHVRSRVGMLGYHGQDDLADGWQPTGDLVEVRGDRIQFVGRTSEVINVGGSKVHPLPIEDLISGLEGVSLVRAYGRPNPMTGSILAVDVVAADGTDVEELEDRIRAACAALPAASQPRRVRFVDELEIREGKISRRQPA